jgi:hypothetical protein
MLGINLLLLPSAADSRAHLWALASQLLSWYMGSECCGDSQAAKKEFSDDESQLRLDGWSWGADDGLGGAGGFGGGRGRHK